MHKKTGKNQNLHCSFGPSNIASTGFNCRSLAWAMLIVVVLVDRSNGIDIFLEWHVTLDTTLKPVTQDQPNLVLGIDQMLHDGVSGTNCPIQPGTNWTYVFQTKDQIHIFFYFPSNNFHKAAGGFGPIHVINRNVIAVPFPRPEAEFDLLIGDWFYDSYQSTRALMGIPLVAYHAIPDIFLMNGKGSLGNPMLRISNVGNALSFNFRIQNHQMVLVETEGSCTDQISLDSLDVHVGQSYSVLVTANQNAADYYMVASPKLVNTSEFTSLVGIGVLHYSNSVSQVSGPLPDGPDPFDLDFSVDEAKFIRWNLTAGAARPNLQGTFNVSNVTLSQTFILQGSVAVLKGEPRYVVNNVSYKTPETPLKLADYYVNGTGMYQLDAFPIHSVNDDAAYGRDRNPHRVDRNCVHEQSRCHGFLAFRWFGNGDWSTDSRDTYNLYDPVVRSIVQVYAGGWTAVAFLDNPGMWNLRGKNSVRVYDADPNPAKELPLPENLLRCGIFCSPPAPAPATWT
ncbi:monocopper oxidase-like protein SKU5 [Pyrus ussuriensis x Pyrus communis]|uniref:Monocopper oxidase-like protein SKU5 n=1 Tax=Pyrus ussuriensis x Pyrus communis TaxID=2448454 RepID=A0A5N5F4P4_9ROSA|nr:monocopper oxidase-like protein SKU5 [Pyrus ussuriensis x Pyrus communis]